MPKLGQTEGSVGLKPTLTYLILEKYVLGKSGWTHSTLRKQSFWMGRIIHIQWPWQHPGQGTASSDGCASFCSSCFSYVAVPPILPGRSSSGTAIFLLFCQLFTQQWVIFQGFPQRSAVTCSVASILLIPQDTDFHFTTSLGRHKVHSSFLNKVDFSPRLPSLVVPLGSEHIFKIIFSPVIIFKASLVPCVYLCYLPKIGSCLWCVKRKCIQKCTSWRK